MEMPINKFQLLGKWTPDKLQGYSRQDIGILTNPVAVEKIHKVWSNTEENFDFYFVKQVGAAKFVETGEVTSEWVKQNLKLDIQPNPGNVTVIFTNNRGDEKVPLTAWIMAHRMGHAIRVRNSEWDNFVNELNNDFTRILREAYHYIKTGFGNYKGEQDALLALALAVGTMRSVRMNNLRNWSEFAYELLAQRLLTGSIKFGVLPRCIVPDRRKAWGRPIGRRYCGNVEELSEWSEVLQGYRDHYEYLLDGICSSLVGKMYVM